MERLLEFGRAQPEPPVFYYDGDADLLLLSRHRARLREAFRFVVAEAELVETLVDKARFQALAEQLELPVPSARRLSAADEPPSAVDLRFPVVVKPLTRQDESWKPLAEAKAIHVESPAALSALWPRLAETVPEVLVQEAVPGPESSIESYHAYIDASGEIAGEFTGRKLRTYPRRYGYSTAVTITQSDEVTALGREISRRLGLRGVAKLDLKRGPDGRLRLLEINPRFNLWHHPGAIAGVNLPALVYSDLVGIPRPASARWRPGVSVVQPRTRPPGGPVRRHLAGAMAWLGPRVRGQVRIRLGRPPAPSPGDPLAIASDGPHAAAGGKRQRRHRAGDVRRTERSRAVTPPCATGFSPTSTATSMRCARL